MFKYLSFSCLDCLWCLFPNHRIPPSLFDKANLSKWNLEKFRRTKTSLYLWGGREGNSRASKLLILGALFDGRNQLKANYLMSVETSKGLLNEIGSESLVSGTHTSPSAAAQKIDSVATADVVNVSMCQQPQVLLNHCVRFFMEN